MKQTGEDMLDILCTRAFVGLMFSSESIGRDAKFFRKQLAKLEHWSGFHDFCRNAMKTDFAEKLSADNIVSTGFVFFMRVVLVLHRIGMRKMSAALMMQASRYIVRKKRQNTANY
jgi:hypothetical protein